METLEITALIKKAPTEAKQNKTNKLHYRNIGIILLIIFIFLLIFNNIKLYIETKLLNKKIQILNTEKESFINDTNKCMKDKINLQKEREIFEKYKLERAIKFNRLLCPKEVIGKKKVLLGKPGDGAYVLLYDLSDVKIADSFGISYTIYFDKSLADKGIDAYMYDHTINQLPYKNPKFHWKKIGITNESKKSDNMKTLIDLLKENGHLKEKNMILKIEIKSNEWRVLKELTPNILNQFKFIIMEFHFDKMSKKYDLYLECLTKLAKDHQIFHIHCCNCGKLVDLVGDNPICEIIEVSYIKREGNQFKKDESIYPIKEFDFKDCPYKPSLNKEKNIMKFCDNFEF